jgi:hypothetical protein
VQLDRSHNLDVSAECKVGQRGRQSACRHSPVEESSPYIEILTRRDSLTSQESQLGKVDPRGPSWRPLLAGAAGRDRATEGICVSKASILARILYRSRRPLTLPTAPGHNPGVSIGERHLPVVAVRIQ